MEIFQYFLKDRTVVCRAINSRCPLPSNKKNKSKKEERAENNMSETYPVQDRGEILALQSQSEHQMPGDGKTERETSRKRWGEGWVPLPRNPALHVSLKTYDQSASQQGVYLPYLLPTYRQTCCRLTSFEFAE